jgi:hypothetical protein
MDRTNTPSYPCVLLVGARLTPSSEEDDGLKPHLHERCECHELSPLRCTQLTIQIAKLGFDVGEHCPRCRKLIACWRSGGTYELLAGL